MIFINIYSGSTILRYATRTCTAFKQDRAEESNNVE